MIASVNRTQRIDSNCQFLSGAKQRDIRVMRYSLPLFALALGILGVMTVDALFSAATSVVQSALAYPR